MQYFDTGTNLKLNIETLRFLGNSMKSRFSIEIPLEIHCFSMFGRAPRIRNASPPVVRSTLLHFSLLDGPSGKNPRFYKFVCICTFHCDIKAALLEHPEQLTIVILVHLLSFHGRSSFIQVDAETAKCKGKLSTCIVVVQGLSLLRRAPW